MPTTEELRNSTLLNVKESDFLFRQVTVQGIYWRGPSQGQGDLHQTCMPRTFQRFERTVAVGPGSSSLLPTLECPCRFTGPLSHSPPCPSHLASLWPTLDFCFCSRGLGLSVQSLISSLFPFYLQACSSPQHLSKITSHQPSYPCEPQFPSYQAQDLCVSIIPLSLPQATFPGTTMEATDKHPHLFLFSVTTATAHVLTLLQCSLVPPSNGLHSVSKKFYLAPHSWG